jgi:hypothetical protein
MPAKSPPASSGQNRTGDGENVQNEGETSPFSLTSATGLEPATTESTVRKVKTSSSENIATCGSPTENLADGVANMLAATPDLAELVALWPKLGADVRKMMVKVARVSMPDSQ